MDDLSLGEMIFNFMDDLSLGEMIFDVRFLCIKDSSPVCSCRGFADLRCIRLLPHSLIGSD